MAQVLQLWPKVVLGLLAIAIWMLDLSWYLQAPDSIIILLLIPLAVFFASKSKGMPRELSTIRLYLLTLLLGLGVIANSMLLMAFAWGGLAQYVFFRETTLSQKRLWLLCSGAFPWVLIDLYQVGWLFRLSGAAITGVFYDLIGLNVQVNGTQLLIGEMPVSIEAACGGLQLLQVLLSGGVALTLIQFPRERGFWTMIGLLPVLAWLANTFRIIVICGWGLFFGVESASGAFHTWGAMVVVVTMLVLYMLSSRCLLVRAKNKS